MPAISLALYVLLGLFVADCVIELAFISSMVGWLAKLQGFKINYNGSGFELFPKPAHMFVDQGHSSNGVAGTGIIVVGIFGIIALWLRSRPNYRSSRASTLFYSFWLCVTTLAFVYTLATLAYVFAVTNKYSGQTIDVAFASTLDDGKYTKDSWTPQSWFAAVLQLNLADHVQKSDISQHLQIMHGWQYNLIPIFLLHLAVTVLMWMDAIGQRHRSPSKEFLS